MSGKDDTDVALDQAAGSPEATGTEIDVPTESMTFTVSIPVQVHEVPEHEVALSIDDIAVVADQLDVAAPGTTSIAFAPETVAAVATAPEPERVVIPDLPNPLSDDKLMRPGRKPAPEGGANEAIYKATFGLINLGDSREVRERKITEARVTRQFPGGTRSIAVLSRKGGVGKTTVSTLLAMALADIRDDRVLAIDANPDRGTLAERVDRQTRASVRDVVERGATIRTFNEFQTFITRDTTMLDVLASDSDPLLSAAFNERDYHAVVSAAERFYSLMITDSGTGMVHSVMRATLQRADSLVIVSGGSVDEARLASETLTWLESNGYEELARNAIVALNTATHGTNLVKLEEIEAHFASRARDIVRFPYDPSLATGSVIRFTDLHPLTRNAARELAALIMDGLPDERVI